MELADLVAYAIMYSFIGSFGFGYWLSNKSQTKKRRRDEEWIELKGSSFYSSPDYPYTTYKTVKYERGI
jgi:hypothetical protein|tara:strand:+ start:240 stop:446 length:207 start_codon:yes stop_codon:yes gene_type:complete